MEREIHLCGKYAFPNTPNPSLGNSPEAHQAVLDEFKIQKGAKVYIQLRDYDDFKGFDLSNQKRLSSISKRIPLDLRNLRF